MDGKREVDDVDGDAKRIPMMEASEQQINSKISSETSTDGETIFRCAQCNFLSPSHSETYQHMFSHFKLSERDNPRLFLNGEDAARFPSSSSSYP